MKKQHTSTIFLFLALAMVASLCVSPIVGAYPDAAASEARTETAPVVLTPASPQVNPPLQDVVGLYAGNYTACAITSSGEVKCWGGGPLGNGTPRSSSLPIEIPDLHGATALAGGDGHMCAITSSGGVKCWGANWQGQLGDGTADDSYTPVDVVGLGSGVIRIAGGDNHTCVLTGGGGVKCWGANDMGQLGDGTTTSSNTPVDVVGLSSGVVALGAGMWHTCAATSSGGVKCWGHIVDHPTPVDVAGLSDVVDVTAGLFHSCALTSGGKVKCWGPDLSPVAIPGLGGVTALVTAAAHDCVITSGGGVKCWGMNSYGQLGDGTTTDRSAPVDVVGLGSGVSMVALGVEFSCAAVGGGVKCWGWDSMGQLGTGRISNRYLPMDVIGLTNGLSAISAADGHTCALTNSGGVKCWGENFGGKLGDGSYMQRSTPADVCAGGAAGCTVPLSGVAAMTAGGSTTCALTNIGGVKCWGQWVGDGTTSSRNLPVDVCAGGAAGCTAPLSGITGVATGAVHTCAVTSSGGVKCWGGNDYGQVGDGTKTGRLRPVDVVGLSSGVAAVTAGGNSGMSSGHTCALTSSGGVKCWGYNGNGQLGDGTTTDSSTPVDVVGLNSGVVAVAAGAMRTCAVTSSGGVKCWGAGRLGNGATAGSNTPVDVCAGGAAACTANLSDVTKVTVGFIHTCALTSSGAVKCWGPNATIGAGLLTGAQTMPVDVIGLGSGVSALDAGSHTCVLVGDGRPKCWGGDGYGQLGLGTTDVQLTPVDVVAAVLPSLFLNYPIGKPGSFVTLTGERFPANTALTLTVNGATLTETPVTTASGGFILFLDTAAADPGLYTVTATAGVGAAASFVLDPNAPLRAQEGGGTTFALPGGIAQPAIPIYLPLMQR